MRRTTVIWELSYWVDAATASLLCPNCSVVDQITCDCEETI